MRQLVLSLWCLVLAAPAQATTIWAAWDLDLKDHEPPVTFVLTVASPSNMSLPPPMTIPWARCMQVPKAQYCAPVGCPPAGVYEFWVMAHYEEGFSAKSNIATCTIPLVGATCQCVDGKGEALALPAEKPPEKPITPVALPVVDTSPPPELPPLSDEIPPLSDEMPALPQHGPEGLDLKPVGPISNPLEIPKPPPCEVLCEWLK